MSASDYNRGVYMVSASYLASYYIKLPILFIDLGPERELTHLHFVFLYLKHRFLKCDTCFRGVFYSVC